jgi:predicted dehydrogenase
MELMGNSTHLLDTLLYLLDARADTVPGYITGEEAILSLEVILAFYRSHVTGSHASVPLDRPLRDVTITSW